MQTPKLIHTSEFISGGHPDKACDQISDAVLDDVLDRAAKLGIPGSACRTAIECLVKGNMMMISGEIGAPQDVLAGINYEQIGKRVWSNIDYDHEGPPVVLAYVQPQSGEIKDMVDAHGDASCAGDQGIMCGFAYRGPNYMPPEYEASRNLIFALDHARKSGALAYLRSDAKSQVSMSDDGEIFSVIISTQHDAEIPLEDLRRDVFERIVQPVLGDVAKDRVKINHRGSFVMGGAAADAGVTGRKIVCDQYGPRMQVGGGAFSGKDPSKVDRSAALIGRLIAKTALMKQFPDAKSAKVKLAYGIGQVQPCALMAKLDDGRDISGWVREAFPDLSPRWIQTRLGLWERKGWTYLESAAMGAFGREQFPWELVD